MGERRPWFGPYRVGWGWGPRTWQGYALVLLLVAAFVAARRVLHLF